MKDLFLDIVINRSKTVADRIRRLYLQEIAILDRTDVRPPSSTITFLL